MFETDVCVSEPNRDGDGIKLGKRALPSRDRKGVGAFFFKEQRLQGSDHGPAGPPKVIKTLNEKTVGRRKRLPHVEQVGQALLPANSGLFNGACNRSKSGPVLVALPGGRGSVWNKVRIIFGRSSH
jgi:hypothetical protein